MRCNMRALSATRVCVRRMRGSAKGVAASGPSATRMGLSGIPVAAELIALHTIFELVRSTRARVHLCRISSAAGIELVRQAKAEGPARDPM